MFFLFNDPKKRKKDELKIMVRENYMHEFMWFFLMQFGVLLLNIIFKNTIPLSAIQWMIR